MCGHKKQNKQHKTKTVRREMKVIGGIRSGDMSKTPFVSRRNCDGAYKVSLSRANAACFALGGLASNGGGGGPREPRILGVRPAARRLAARPDVPFPYRDVSKKKIDCMLTAFALICI